MSGLLSFLLGGVAMLALQVVAIVAAVTFFPTSEDEE